MMIRKVFTHGVDGISGGSGSGYYSFSIVSREVYYLIQKEYVPSEFFVHNKRALAHMPIGCRRNEGRADN